MKKFLITMVALCALVFSSCTTFVAEGLSVMPTDNNLEVVGNFSETFWAHKFLGLSGGNTLFNIGQGATKDKIVGRIYTEVQKAGGTGAINVTIKQSNHIGHWILNGLTFGIWAPVKIKVTGTIVRRTNGSVSMADIEKALDDAIAFANGETPSVITVDDSMMVSMAQ